jgi:DNA-binding LytR/AlgR family response regulator
MEIEGAYRNRYHPDVIIFLVLIPFISAFNYYLTYSNIQINWFLFLTFSIDTAQGYVAWWALRTYIIYLDKRVPFEEHTLRRIVLQQIGTMVIGLAVISLLTELVSWIAKGKPAPLSFYTIDLFIISIWFFVVNGIYAGLHYYNQSQELEAIRNEENKIKTAGLMVRHGKHSLRVDFEDLVGLYVDGVFVVASDRDARRYYVDLSLDKVERKLPSSLFFRLNRQYIVHRQMVSGFTRAENKKIQVRLNNHQLFPPEVTVSRTKAAPFKAWFHSEGDTS